MLGSPVRRKSGASRIPREQLVEAAQVNQTVRQYLVEFGAAEPSEAPVHRQEQVSTTGPDATYATKGGTPVRLGYYLGVQATDAHEPGDGGRPRHDRAFRRMARTEARVGGRDATHGNGEFRSG